MEERSQHLFYHPLCRQSYWCLCHRSALAQLEPQLETRNREELRKENDDVLHKLRPLKIKTLCYGYLNLKFIFKKKKCSGVNSMPTLALLAVGISSLQVGVRLTPLLFPYSARFVPHTQCLSPTKPKTPARLSQEQACFKSLHNSQTKMCQRANQIKLS